MLLRRVYQNARCQEMAARLPYFHSGGQGVSFEQEGGDVRVYEARRHRLLSRPPGTLQPLQKLRKLSIARPHVVALTEKLLNVLDGTHVLLNGQLL